MSLVCSMRRYVISLGLLAVFALVASSAKADTVFLTPAGSTLGGSPVNASATFNQSGNILTITLQNLQANPTSVIQAISGFRFTVATGLGTLTSSSGDHIDIAANGTFGDLGVSATDWSLSSSGGSYFLNGLGPSGWSISSPGPPCSISTVERDKPPKNKQTRSWRSRPEPDRPAFGPRGRR